MKLILLPALLFSLQCFAQKDTIRITNTEAVHIGMNTTAYKNTYVIVYNPKDSKIISETPYLNGKMDGVATEYNGDKIRWQASFKNGLKDGDYVLYYNNGIAERKENFSTGNVVSGHCYDDHGVEIPYFTEPFTFVERMPVATANWQQYFDREILYPEAAIKANIQGRVIVKFVIMADGTINNPVVIRGLSKECDEEAIRLVKGMPRFKPGNQGGKNVNVYFTLPVIFKR